MKPRDYRKEITTRVDKTLGYIYFIDRKHPLAAPKTGRVYHHRHVASVTLNRWLRHTEHVHHIDGNRKNNQPENLQVLTASEHAHRHKPPRPAKPCALCKKPTTNKTFCSVICSAARQRKVKRPTRAVLKREMSRLSWRALGRLYGVSDNAVRKWARQLDLLHSD